MMDIRTKNNLEVVLKIIKENSFSSLDELTEFSKGNNDYLGLGYQKYRRIIKLKEVQDMFVNNDKIALEENKINTVMQITEKYPFINEGTILDCMNSTIHSGLKKFIKEDVNIEDYISIFKSEVVCDADFDKLKEILLDNLSPVVTDDIMRIFRSNGVNTGNSVDKASLFSEGLINYGEDVFIKGTFQRIGKYNETSSELANNFTDRYSVLLRDVVISNGYDQQFIEHIWLRLGEYNDTIKELKYSTKLGAEVRAKGIYSFYNKVGIGKRVNIEEVIITKII